MFITFYFQSWIAIDKNKSFDNMKFGVSFMFNPGILESRPIDSSLLKVPHAQVDFVLPSVKPVELIHPLSSDLALDISHRSCEVNCWFNGHIFFIIIYADLPLDKYAFYN